MTGRGPVRKSRNFFPQFCFRTFFPVLFFRSFLRTFLPGTFSLTFSSRTFSSRTIYPVFFSRTFSCTFSKVATFEIQRFKISVSCFSSTCRYNTVPVPYGISIQTSPVGWGARMRDLKGPTINLFKGKED